MSTPTSSPANQRKAGDLDPSFGSGGTVDIMEPPRPPSRLYIDAVAPVPSDSGEQYIYVACTGRHMDQSYIVRMRGNGTLDAGFGNAGYVQIPLLEPLGTVAAISGFLFLESGNVIGHGRVWGGQGFYLPAAVCITPDGSLDTSFGDQGLAIYNPPLPEDLKPETELKQEPLPSRNRQQKHSSWTPATASTRADDKLLFLAAVVDGFYDHVASFALKITPSGALDNRFGKGGFVLIEDSTVSPARLLDARDYDIDFQGGIVVAGTVRTGNEQEGLVARYDARGVLDRGFGGTGIVRIVNPSGFSTHMRGVKTSEDGKVIALAAFFTAQSLYQHPAVIKLMPAGYLDPSFNNGEPATIDLSPAIFVASGIAIDDGRRIIVGGRSVEDHAPVGPSNACVSRLMPNGILDGSFGEKGTMILEEFHECRGEEVHSGVKAMGILMKPDDVSRVASDYVFRLLG